MTNYTFTSELTRQSSASTTASGQNVKLAAKTRLRLRVNENPPPTAPPSTTPLCTYSLTELVAARLLFEMDDRGGAGPPTPNDVPVAQLDMLFDGEMVFPFMHCQTIDVEQNDKATQEFIAECNYATPTFTEVKPPQLAPLLATTVAAETDYPVIYQHDLRVIDHVIYEDNDTPAKRCELPTGNLFTQPFIEKVPSRIVTVTQYESTFTEELAAERLEMVNSADWNGTVNDGKWKITKIDWTPVRIILSGTTNLATFLVQYEVSYMPKAAGWRSKRALLDTHYLPSPGGPNNQSTRQPFVTSEGGRTNYIGMTDDQGVPSPNQINYIEFIVQPEIAFTFLRAESP